MRKVHSRSKRNAPRTGASAPSQRELFRRTARQLGVSAADYERADILAQIAELLVRHPAIGNVLAFKGGAIMTLVDGSPRLSADLDAVVVTGRALRDRYPEWDAFAAQHEPVAAWHRALAGGPYDFTLELALHGA